MEVSEVKVVEEGDYEERWYIIEYIIYLPNLAHQVPSCYLDSYFTNARSRFHFFRGSNQLG